MEEKKKYREEGVGVELEVLLAVLADKAWVIGIASVLAAVLVLLSTILFVTPQYESTAMFYVNNSNISLGDASFSISSSDISASKSLVSSYIVILNTRESLNEVIDYAGVNRTVEELQEMLFAASVNSTEIFEVVVTSPDPVEAEKIADAIAYILPKRISSIIDGTSAKVVDAAIVAAKPSSPSYTTNTIVGFLLGFVLSIGVIVVREIFDITIRTEEDIQQNCRYPVLASVPDMLSPGKGGYEYGAERRRKTAAVQSRKPGLVGSGMSFAAAEAYKLLRTKLQFSFAGDNNCRVIGLSSPLSGEGKSLTSINLAYSLSQLNKKVILLDCDMRRPTLAEKLGVRKHPGLSSCLTGQSALEELVQYCGLPGEEDAFHMVTAGQNPPNPVELLSSEKMMGVLKDLRQRYDYVILDLPPVGEVSDAMALAKVIDGMLLVVRQNLCNRISLTDAIRQFDFVDTRILGVVFNGIAEQAGSYRKGYYRKDGYRSYESSTRSAETRKRKTEKESVETK